MSWLGQVAQVMRKDVRQAGWVIGIVLAALAVATVQAMEWTTGLPGPLESVARYLDPLWSGLRSGTSLLLISGILLVGLLVQADAPARSDAFWVTRPLSPSAVFTAKVALAGLLLLVLPLGAELAALSAHQAPARSLPLLLGWSVAAPLVLFSVAGVVAALTRDLKTFLVALFLTALVGTSVLRWTHSLLHWQAFPWGGASMLQAEAALFPVLGLGLVAYQYHVRDSVRTLRVFALPVLVVLALSAAYPLARTESSATAHGTPTPGAVLRFQGLHPLTQAGRVDGARLELAVDLPDAPQQLRYTLLQSTVTIHLADGSVFKTRSNLLDASLNHPRPDVAGVERWLANKGPVRAERQALAMLTPKVAASLREHGGRVAVNGPVEVFEPELLGRLALDRDRELKLERAGKHVRIVSVAGEDDVRNVDMVIESVEPTGSLASRALDRGVDTYGFILLRGDPREASLLSTSPGGGTSRGLVLPGVRAFTETVHVKLPLSTTRGAAAAPVPGRLPRAMSAGRLDGAELLLIHWTKVGAYTLHAETTVPPSGR